MHPPQDIPTRPAWITDQIMAYTRRVWEPRYGHALNDDEIIEMLVNVTRLFEVLTTASTGATPQSEREEPVQAASSQSSPRRGKAIEPATVG